MLTHIPTHVLLPETCRFEVNTGRLHNEILKHRLSCIPVHAAMTDAEELAHCTVVVDVENTTNSMMMVTTEHFRVRDEVTGQFYSDDRAHMLFPKCDLTQSYILFARLRPKINDLIPGERIRFTCRFGLGMGKDSSCYSAVCTSTYMNTLDESRIKEVWAEQEAALTAEGRTKEEIIFQRRNFMLLDSQRHFVDDSFDFTVETIGVHSNMTIVKTACATLKTQFETIARSIEDGRATFVPSMVTTPHSFDFIVEEGDYTIGPVLEYFVYEKYFLLSKEVSFCGFKKFHPHNTDSTLRIAFANVDRGEGEEEAVKMDMDDDDVTGKTMDKKEVEQRIQSEIVDEYKNIGKNEDLNRRRTIQIVADACRLAILYYTQVLDRLDTRSMEESMDGNI
jgi:DNA-directed RNA polymerase subunit L